MTKNALNEFLNDIKENKIAVTVFLINGVKLQGVITFFDETSLMPFIPTFTSKTSAPFSS